jgi:hypothetical protein
MHQIAARLFDRGSHLGNAAQIVCLRRFTVDEEDVGVDAGCADRANLDVDEHSVRGPLRRRIHVGERENFHSPPMRSPAALKTVPKITQNTPAVVFASSAIADVLTVRYATSNIGVAERSTRSQGSSVRRKSRRERMKIKAKIESKRPTPTTPDSTSK